VRGPAHGPSQQLRDVPLQTVIGRQPDGALHAPLFQRRVDLRFGKGGVGPEHHLLALLLLPIDLRQQQFFPAVGAVDSVCGPATGVAGPELDRQPIPG